MMSVDAQHSENESRCKLCGMLFADSEMSEEHYPARSVGNNDVVGINIVAMFDMLMSKETMSNISEQMQKGNSLESITEGIFDKELAIPLFPKGRTLKTLCRTCNTFLGKYDEAYLKFFSLDGNPEKIKGFQQQTKLQVIKSIFGKFLSVPEAKDESFDFIDFVKDASVAGYIGKWKLFFVRRTFNSDIIGFKDIGTGRANFDEGVVYELSDEKFIFNLMNFEKHSCYEMTNIFDILNKSYSLVDGVGKYGGYHAQILISRLLCDREEPST
jgi:hypothetical protein